MTSSTFLMTCAAALSQKLSYNKGRSGFQHLRGEILSKRLVLSIMMIGVLAYSHSAFGQTAPTGQQRIVQPIIINGQQAQGVLVIQNETVQGYTCPSPQHYVTVDQSSSGWACFEQTTGMWLLHAQPPRQTTYAYRPPPVYVPAPTSPVYSYDAYGYYPYGFYPYAYYPYSYYPYIIGPRFGFGFGFGYRSPVIVSRPIISRPFAPFVQPRPFRGFGPARTGVAFGRIGRR